MATSQSQRAPLPPQQFPGKPKPKGFPKRGGPRPARHIPWPEIFKHHISLVEGHLKMIEMVKKHTLEGSGNYQTMSNLVHRSKDMLHQAKKVARNFVPPPGLFEQVPLGVASDTMYPGYSPGHHEYGKAAEEFGRYASEAKKKGLEIKPEDVEYEIGQSRGLGHRTLAQIRATNALKNDSGSGSDAGAATRPKPSSEAEKNASKTEGDAKNSTEKAGDQMFFMDSNPTPINLLNNTANSSAKRKATPEPIEVEANVSKKKQKKKHAADPTTNTEPVHGHTQEEQPPNNETVRVEFEDISAEVDARLKEKEERRRKRKQEKRADDEKKKRKRDSEDASATLATDEQAVTTDPPKPKKRKVKVKKAEDNASPRSPKRKKSATALDDENEEAAEGSSPAVDAEKPKRKKNKVKASHGGSAKEIGKKRGLREEGKADEVAGKKKKARTEAS
ncbi:MAG: hypothetical protein LQ338_004572 [Usnochroma carphineum]|nr:MAG: hypothetical protein LQ338_004572 [Usnochroma carphineum]